MVSLGIFGDSFAANTRCSRHLCRCYIDNPKKKELLINECIKKDPSYWEILRQDKKIFTDVQAYGHGGADNYWSFLNFLSMHDQFDKIIFIITNCARQSLRMDPEQKTKPWPDRDRAWLHNTRLEHIQNERIKIKALSYNSFGKGKKYYHSKQELLKIIDACEMHHKHIIPSDPTREHMFNVMIFNTILQIRPDVKFVVAFDLNFNFKNWNFEPKNKNTTLKNIWNLEESLMNINLDKRDIWDKLKGWPSHALRNQIGKMHDEYNEEMRLDMRIAHMSTDSNILLAKQLEKFIFTNKNWFILDMIPFIHGLRGIKLEDWYITIEEFPQWLEKRGININEYK